MTAQCKAAGPQNSYNEYCAARTLNTVLALAFSALLSASPAVAQAPAAPPDFTIAILDPAEVPEMAPWFAPAEREAQHETNSTFGQGLLSDLANVDAVLLQGVQAAEPLRRMFPPQAWRLIISRNILAAGDQKENQPGAAIAVKSRRDLQITGRALTFQLPKPGALAGDPDLNVAAVRMTVAGRTFWLGSIALPAACRVEDPPCPALQTLNAWREDRRNRMEPALISGRISPQSPPETPSASNGKCGSYSVDADLQWQRTTPDNDGNSSANTKSCISVIRITE